MNTTDMQGNPVNVGDRIAYMEFGKVKAFGTVTNIALYTVDAAWEDKDGCILKIPYSSFVVVNDEIEEKFTKEDEDALVKLLEKKRRVELQQKQATLDHFICRTSPYGSRMIIDWVGRNAEALEPLLSAYNKMKIQK